MGAEHLKDLEKEWIEELDLADRARRLRVAGAFGGRRERAMQAQAWLELWRRANHRPGLVRLALSDWAESVGYKHEAVTGRWLRILQGLGVIRRKGRGKFPALIEVLDPFESKELQFVYCLSPRMRRLYIAVLDRNGRPGQARSQKAECWTGVRGPGARGQGRLNAEC
jgi:hypothetical protein